MDVLQPDINPVIHIANLPDIGQRMRKILCKCDKPHGFVDIQQ